MNNKILLLFLSTCLITLLLEVTLRFLGFTPGKIQYSQWITEVDELNEIKGFISDENGIFKVDTQYLNFFNVPDNNFAIKEYVNNLYKLNFEKEIFSLIDDTYQVRSGVVKNNFSNKLSAINTQNNSEIDSSILHYVSHPINKDGFHSIAFQNYNSDKTKVLLLGDSFTWGHSTINKTNSFANELLAKDYIVYNTGISGTDVSQYKAIAEKYIPILKPDIVVLNFFLGNDVKYYKREIKAFQPMFYSTNAGKLMSNQNGINFENAQDAYQNVMKVTNLQGNSFSEKIVKKTVLSSFVWMVLVKIGFITDFRVNIDLKAEKPFCNQEIEDIKNICKLNTAKFELVTIPDFLYKKTKISQYPFLFEDIEYKMSPVKKSSYQISDGHFNDQGHIEYAIFLDEIIQQNR